MDDDTVAITEQRVEGSFEVAECGREPGILKIQELIGIAQTCFFCTKTTDGRRDATRPTHVQTVDDAGSLWFLSATDSHQNQELKADPSVRLYFQGSPHSNFLQLDGRAAISTDKQKIKEFWKPMLATWFTEGIDDPRITVIEVVPSEGYYWVTKHGNTIAGIKILVDSLIGKTIDDSIAGTLMA